MSPADFTPEAGATTDTIAPRVAVVGGGLAGLAAAAALADCGCRIELFESRRQLGGRAGSFVDPATGEVVDHCQHVGMGCCTNLADFARRGGIEHLLRRERLLHFFGPDGARYDMGSSAWLPAPLHLAPSFLRLGYLSWSERLAVARALRQLARDADSPLAAGQWLRGHGQSQRAIDYFWSVVLTSALGDTIDRVSIGAARKVFLDGFMSNPAAQDVIVPRVPLAELYDRHIGPWLERQGVELRLQTPVTGLEGDSTRVRGVRLADGSRREFDFVIAAVPWRKISELIGPCRWPALDEVAKIEASPITAAHLWFDRPIMELRHAVLVGRLSQWVFAKSDAPAATEGGSSASIYYQVIISGSHDLSARDRQDVIQEICGDLHAVFPGAREAQLVRWRLVTDPAAVFSMRVGVDELRPPQRTPIANFMLAGDWTATGWPATMEGAVRSGYLAAEEVLRAAGRPVRILVPDLPRSFLAKWLL